MYLRGSFTIGTLRVPAVDAHPYTVHVLGLPSMAWLLRSHLQCNIEGSLNQQQLNAITGTSDE